MTVESTHHGLSVHTAKDASLGADTHRQPAIGTACAPDHYPQQRLQRCHLGTVLWATLRSRGPGLSYGGQNGRIQLGLANYILAAAASGEQS